MGSASIWIDHSYELPYRWIPFHLFLITFALATSIFVIIHSYYHHRSCYTSIRILTEIAAGSLLLASCLLLYSFHQGSEHQSVNKLLINFIVYSVLRPISQLCDNYIIYSMLVFMDNLSIAQQVSVISYIACLAFTYIPFGSILPFALDMNVDVMVLVRSIFSCYVYCCGSFVFYFAFIFKLRRLLAKQNSLDLSTRNLIHVIIR
jgi:hypothetical protein